MKEKKTIAVIIFDGVNALDVAGPTEAFATARINGEAIYEVQYWALKDLVVKTESGLKLAADNHIPNSPKADVLIVPGGEGVRETATLKQLATFLLKSHQYFGRIASVCTGTYALAESGLIDNRAVTTHWAFSEDLQRRYPRLKVEASRLFLRDGKYYSSGGITAGIDLALDMIDADFGLEVAMTVARELVVFLRRSGAQQQFSLPLKMQSSASDKIKEVTQWIANNLQKDISVVHLASLSNLSPRQFSRCFKRDVGVSPAAYVKQLRMDTARTLLDNGCAHQKVAQSVGFGSEDGFRRAFESTFGITPLEYQRRFSKHKQVV